MKTKKYDMKGGSGEKGKKWKTAKKIGKAIGSSTLFQGFKYKKHGNIDPKEKKRGTWSKIGAEATGIPMARRVFYQTPKAFLYDAPKYLATRGLARHFSFTRSGKAKKEIRQTTGIKDYNKLKKTVSSIEEKKKKYNELLDQQKTILKNPDFSNANTRSNWGKIFGRRLQTKAYNKQSWLQKKFGKQTKSTQIARKIADIEAKQKEITEKEKFMLTKWEKRAKYRTNKLGKLKNKGINTYKVNTSKTLKNQLDAAAKHVEEQKRIKRDKALQLAFESKKVYNDVKEIYNKVENAFKAARATYYNIPNPTPREKEDFKKAQTEYTTAKKSTKKYSVPTFNANGRPTTSKQQVKYTDLQGIIRKTQTVYDKDQANYQKIAGKAQTLEQLGERAKESIGKSFRRGFNKLTIGPRPFGGLLTTYGKLLKSGNKTKNNETNKSKRDKDLIIKYWTKDKEGREQKLKNYKIIGETYLQRNGKIIDPETKQPQKLEDIIKKTDGEPPNVKDITKTMPYKDYLEHLKTLQTEGKITSKEYDILQKHGKAERITRIIEESEKDKVKKKITKKSENYNTIKKNLGVSGAHYTYGTPIKKQNLNIGFGTQKGVDISKVKLLSLVEYETTEEKTKIESEINYIKNLEVDDESKNDKITALYTKYGVTTPIMGSDTTIIPTNIDDFGDGKITNFVVNTSSIFKDSEVKKELQTIFTVDPNDPTKIKEPDNNFLKSQIETEKKAEDTTFTNEIKLPITSAPTIANIKTKLTGINTNSTPEGKEFKIASIVTEALKLKMNTITDLITDGNRDNMNKLRDLNLLSDDGNTADRDKVLKHMLETNKELEIELKTIDPDFNVDQYKNKTATDIFNMKAGALEEITKKTEENTQVLREVSQKLLDLPIEPTKTKIEDDTSFIDFKNKKIASDTDEAVKLTISARQSINDYNTNQKGNIVQNGQDLVDRYLKAPTKEEKEKIVQEINIYTQNTPAEKTIIDKIVTAKDELDAGNNKLREADPITYAGKKITEANNAIDTLKAKITAINPAADTPELLMKDYFNETDAAAKAEKLEEMKKYSTDQTKVANNDLNQLIQNEKLISEETAFKTEAEASFPKEILDKFIKKPAAAVATGTVAPPTNEALVQAYKTFGELKSQESNLNLEAQKLQRDLQTITSLA